MSRTFIAALREFFGVLPEYRGVQGLKGFALEIKQLTPKDREEFGTMLSVEFATEITDVTKV